MNLSNLIDIEDMVFDSDLEFTIEYTFIKGSEPIIHPVDFADPGEPDIVEDVKIMAGGIDITGLISEGTYDAIVESIVEYEIYDKDDY